jgi:hypothetical protein
MHGENNVVKSVVVLSILCKYFLQRETTQATTIEPVCSEEKELQRRCDATARL